MSTTDAPFQLTIDGIASDDFRVRSFKGRETLSDVWRFDLAITARDDIETTALGRRATLIFNMTEKQRAFYGIISSVRLAEVHAGDHSTKYIVRVVPRLRRRIPTSRNYSGRFRR